MIALLKQLTTFDRVAIAVAAVSAGTLLAELLWTHELETPAPAAETAAETEPPAVDVISVGSVTEYLEVSERPLFNHERRPFVAVAEPVPVAAGPRVELQLTAVIITDTAQIALLRSNLTPIVQRLTVDQAIDGWTLAEVHPESVLLRRNAETMSVHLRPDLGLTSGQPSTRRSPRAQATR